MAELLNYIRIPLDDMERKIGFVEGVAVGVRDHDAQVALLDWCESMDCIVAKAKEEAGLG